MKKQILITLLTIAGLYLTTCRAQAQTFAALPEASQMARVMQRVGLTDVTITYHRPLVKGRKLWGSLVPYGKVWRAGANENTTIEVTDPVTVEGSPLPKGTYGLHMIPGESEWTVILSNISSAWGSFTYDQSEDAIRVKVKPRPAEFQEALSYQFDDIQPESAVITMRWGTIAVPFKVSVNVNGVVYRSLKNQLRGGLQYTWEGWDEAANYILSSKGNLDDGLKYADQSIQAEERFDNLMTKSRILEALGRKDQAAAISNRAMEMGSAVQLHSFGRQLMLAGHQDQGFAIFRTNIKRNPKNWLVQSEISRLAVARGDFAAAAVAMKACLAGAPEQVKPQIESLLKRVEAREDINK